MLTALLIATVLGGPTPYIPGQLEARPYGPLAGAHLTVTEREGNTVASTVGTIGLLLPPGTYTATATWHGETCGSQTVGLYPRTTVTWRHRRRTTKVTGGTAHLTFKCAV